MPAGPPPAFIETLLERQAREGFTEMKEPASTETETTPLTQETRAAETGFEAGREVTKQSASPIAIDNRR